MLYKLTNLPSTLAFVEAFSLVAGNIKPIQRQLLLHQYHAPQRTLCASELARLAGLASPIRVNHFYGKLGRMLVEAIEFEPSRREGGGFRWWAVLSAGYTGDDGLFHWVMHDEIAEAMEELGWVRDMLFHADEIAPSETGIVEGAVTVVSVNRYERDATARRLCLDHYGTACTACGLHFEERYGEIGTGYIHTHHIVPLSEIGCSYVVDPIADLRPVCPNCHAMLHRRKPPFSIEELKAILQAP